jgi:hypothetical protein
MTLLPASEKGLSLMTMFSMKPEFNLPEFLAKWEPGSTKSRPEAKPKGRQYRRPPARKSAPGAISDGVQSTADGNA